MAYPHNKRELKSFRAFDKALEAAQTGKKEILQANINLAARTAMQLTTGSGIRHVVLRVTAISKGDLPHKEAAIYAADSIMRHAAGDEVLQSKFERHLQPHLRNMFKRALKLERTRNVLADKFLNKIIAKWRDKKWFANDIEIWAAFIRKTVQKSEHGRDTLLDVLVEDTGPVEDREDREDPIFDSSPPKLVGATAKAGAPKTPPQPLFLISDPMPGTPDDFEEQGSPRSPFRVKLEDSVRGPPPKGPPRKAALDLTGATVRERLLLSAPRTPQEDAEVYNMTPVKRAPGDPFSPIVSPTAMPKSPGPAPGTPSGGRGVVQPFTPRRSGMVKVEPGQPVPSTPNGGSVQPFTPRPSGGISQPFTPGGAAITASAPFTPNLMSMSAAPFTPPVQAAPGTPNMQQPFVRPALSTPTAIQPFTPRPQAQPFTPVLPGVAGPGTPAFRGPGTPAPCGVGPSTPAPMQGPGTPMPFGMAPGTPGAAPGTPSAMAAFAKMAPSTPAFAPFAAGSAAPSTPALGGFNPAFAAIRPAPGTPGFVPVAGGDAAPTTPVFASLQGPFQPFRPPSHRGALPPASARLPSLSAAADPVPPALPEVTPQPTEPAHSSEEATRGEAMPPSNEESRGQKRPLDVDPPVGLEEPDAKRPPLPAVASTEEVLDLPNAEDTAVAATSSLAAAKEDGLELPTAEGTAVAAASSLAAAKEESEKPAERIPGAPDDDPEKEASLPAFGTMLDRPETVQSQLAEPVAGGPDSEPPARFGAPLLPILGSQASAATLDLDADDDEHLFSDDDAT